MIANLPQAWYQLILGSLPLRLADLLNMTAPTLPTAASLSKTSLQIVESGSLFNKGEEIITTGGIWDDEEERRFYEDVLDLAEDVPGALLGLTKDGKKEKQEEDIISPPVKAESVYSDTGSNHPSDLALSEDGFHNLDDGEEVKAKAEQEPVEEQISSGPAARLNAIFAALPEANNKAMIDKLAVDFGFLNSKAARKRCYKVRSYRILS